MTSLLARIKAQIAENGPIDIANFMTMCLTDPHEGYYTTRNPFGSTGDFITAPDISQIFGELIGIWCYEAAQNKPIHLTELGPGRGTLMSDILRTWRKLTNGTTPPVHMVEISPRLSQIQQQNLSAYDTITWHKTIDTLPQAPIVFIANEFFDALPIHQYQYDAAQNHWAERAIGLAPDGSLQIGRKPDSTPPALPASAPDNALFEISPMSLTIIAKIAHHIAANAGAALFIDYGHLQSGFGDTLQAMRSHAYADILDAPGTADLTAHVDFAALQQAAQKAAPIDTFTTTQGDFLLNMGLLERAGQLGHKANDKDRDILQAQVKRLAAPDEMGKLFKVMALMQKDNLRDTKPNGF